MMKGLVIVMLVLAAGCGSSKSGSASSTARPLTGAHAAAAPTSSGDYLLLGLITGPRSYFDQKRCLAMLKVYAEAMETGLGNGSSTKLRCVPA